MTHEAPSWVTSCLIMKHAAAPTLRSLKLRIVFIHSVVTYCVCGCKCQLEHAMLLFPHQGFAHEVAKSAPALAAPSAEVAQPAPTLLRPNAPVLRAFACTRRLSDPQVAFANMPGLLDFGMGNIDLWRSEEMQLVQVCACRVVHVAGRLRSARARSCITP